MIYSKNCRDTALELMHRFGLWPVAIRPGSKIPIGWSKAPAKPTEKSIRDTFAAYPGAGLGLLLGPEAGIIDIECDGPEGPDSLFKLLGTEEMSTIGISTMGWSSAKGPHCLFKYDPRLARYGKNVIMLPDLPGLEIRIGGLDGPLQSNCPPTKGTDGKPREWNGCDVVAELPEAVFSFLDNHGAADPVEEFEGSANLEHPVEAITLPNSPIWGAREVPANSDPYVALITASWGRLKSDDKRRLAEIVMDCISGIKV